MKSIVMSKVYLLQDAVQFHKKKKKKVKAKRIRNLFFPHIGDQRQDPDMAAPQAQVPDSDLLLGHP